MTTSEELRTPKTKAGKALSRSILERPQAIFRADWLNEQIAAIEDEVLGSPASPEAPTPASPDEHRMGPPHWEPGLAQDEWAHRCVVDGELWPCSGVREAPTPASPADALHVALDEAFGSDRDQAYEADTVHSVVDAVLGVRGEGPPADDNGEGERRAFNQQDWGQS